MFLHVSVSLSTGAFCMSDLLSGCLIPYSLEVGLCPWFHVPCLSKGFSVQGDLCPGVAVQESGSLSRESLSRGLSPGEGSLFRGRAPVQWVCLSTKGSLQGVSVQGNSVQGSLSRGSLSRSLSLRVYVKAVSIQGASVQRISVQGSLSWRVPCPGGSLQRPPESEKRALPILLECFLLL